MSSIGFRSVSKDYGPVRALDDISFEVSENEFATILGPSGSGKSTMLSLVAGIINPTAGQILVGGRDVTWLPAPQRNVGLVFQSYALFPHMSVFDNVAFPLAIRRVQRREINERVEAMLALVRLSEFGRRRPSQLSGGQQQRVALARALVFKPDILLLDEPLAALDRKLREEVRLELRRLQRSLGITALLVTHDQEEALSVSDRIMILRGGRIEQIDTPADLYHRPRSRFVADFMGAANFLEGGFQRQGDQGGIRLEGGDFFACAGAPTSGSGRLCGVIRPEQIRLSDTARTTNAVNVRVADAIFFGDLVRYTIILPSGLSLIAHSPETRSICPVGSTMWADWEPSSLWLLSEAG